MTRRLYTAESKKWKTHGMMPVVLPVATEWLKCLRTPDRRLEDAHSKFYQKNKFKPHKSLAPLREPNKNEFWYVSAFNYTCDKMAEHHILI